MDATCVTISNAGWVRDGVFMWGDVLATGVKSGRNLCSDRQRPPQCPFTPVAVCSLCPGAALSSLAAAGIISLVERLTESCWRVPWGFKSLGGVGNEGLQWCYVGFFKMQFLKDESSFWGEAFKLWLKQNYAGPARIQTVLYLFFSFWNVIYFSAGSILF